MILDKYLTKEALKAQVSILLVLLSILVSQSFIKKLADAADGDIPANFILQLVALQLPYIITLILPFSLFLVILFSSRSAVRLTAKMTAMHAGSCGERHVIWLMLRIAFYNMLLFCALSFS